MRTINRDKETIDPTPPRRRSPWIAAVAAVAVLALIGLATFFTNRDSSGPADTAPPTTIDADAMAIADALDAVEALWAAVGENDLDAIQRLTAPGGSLGSREQRVWGFHFVMDAAGFGDELGDCQASMGSPATSVSISCDFTIQNPVFAALGPTGTTASFDYRLEERRLEGRIGSPDLWPWAEMPDSFIDEPMRAMANYLRLIDEDAWLETCAPAAYGGSDEVVHTQGLAMAPECAELLVPLLPDIAQWVDAGQPDEWPSA